MTEAQVKRHGLESFMRSVSPGSATKSALNIRIETRLSYINLRGNPGDRYFASATESTLDQSLPVAANTVTFGRHRVYWLGPDEWLVATDADGLVEKLSDSLATTHAAVNDVSGGLTGIRIAGTHVRDTLAKGCTLDLHHRVFSRGMCAQSGLARANALIGTTEEPDVFHIIVRRSYCDYLIRWLQHAAAEYGATISA